MTDKTTPIQEWIEDEIYKDIPNYEGRYYASNLGNIKSIRMGKGTILKPEVNDKGYLRVNLYKDKVRKKMCVHILVAMSFYGHKPNGTNGICVDHINNIKTDNRIDNLQIISHREDASKDRAGGTSKYVGISWKKSHNKWRAAIYIDKKWQHLGYFQNEQDANEVYQKALQSLKQINPPL